MTQVADVMTRGVRSMAPQDSVQFAAQAMDELNVGVIPVCDDERLVGLLTDRDIVVRAVAHNLAAASTPLSDVMTAVVASCHEDDAIEDVMRRMEEQQIRRLPVLDREERLVGMLSLGDVATKAEIDNAGLVLAQVSQPAQPERPDEAVGGGGGSSGGEASTTPT